MKSFAEELKDKTIISLGGYEYLKNNYDLLKNITEIDFICGNEKYVQVSGCRIIAREDILRFEHPFVIISLAMPNEIREAADWCRQNDLPFTHLSFVIAHETLDAKYIAALGGTYTDYKNNTVSVSPRANGEILIDLKKAENAVVEVGTVHVKGRLHIEMFGDGGSLRIGSGTTFVRVNINVNTGGIVDIGEDCMFSHSISLMQSDMHMIFDAATGKRINYARPIRIGNHVWAGREAQILGGAEIGDNSVIGARAVTSGKFPNNVIIAGCPARVIREGVIWSRDLIEEHSADDFCECRDQAALKYPDQQTAKDELK